VALPEKAMSGGGKNGVIYLSKWKYAVTFYGELLLHGVSDRKNL